MGSGDVARRYHRETEQGPRRRPRPSVAGFVPMDPDRRPAPFKRYPQAPWHALPTELPPWGAPASAALSGRVPAAGIEVDLDLLARLLFHAAGVVRTAGPAIDRTWFRAAPSAGNLHPIEVYVATGGMAGLGAGLYHFAPDGFGLEQLAAGDCRAGIAEAAADPRVATSPLVLVLTGIPWRTAWKYADRGWRHVYWDAGTMLANLLTVAEGYRLPATVLLGFVDGALCHRLGVDGVTEFPVAVAVVGGTPSPPAASGRVGPAGPRLAVAPPPPDPVEFPRITEVQRAGDLATAAEVAAWRATDATGLSRAPDAADPAVASDEPIESVILRRGSTRRMRHGVVPPEVLHWPMAVAARHPPIDAVPAGASLLFHQIAIHAVRDRQPGLYQWVDGAVRLCRAASETEVRRRSEQLCLDQPLGGDAAYTVFFCADLDTVLGRYGDRGYRIAQLEAGLAAGRLQLAVFAAGLGGSNLTFADEEVTAEFGTPAACMLVSAVGIPGYRARPGGPPGRPTRISR